MSDRVRRIELKEEDRKTLERWIRSSTTEQRLVFRARIILEAGAGSKSLDIAGKLGTSVITVNKWRRRFGKGGLTGLQDAPRSGKTTVYDEETEKRILSLLDEPAPMGYSGWNGRLLAEALGNVSKHQVWRVLRNHGIQLQRRRSWCISTDPEFVPKAADVVGLYLEPPENAVVLCVDEKPAIQALERAQGYIRLPNGGAMLGVGHEYKRHGTTTLFAALDVVTGQVKEGHYKRRRRREFLQFMNEVLTDYGHREIHVILDNLNTHKPKKDRWLAKHENVHFHFTPTHASWLNQVETWFSILSRQAIKGANFTSPQDVRNAIDRFVAVYNRDAAPFEWRKRSVHPVGLKKKYRDLCN